MTQEKKAWYESKTKWAGVLGVMGVRDLPVLNRK